MPERLTDRSIARIVKERCGEAARARGLSEAEAQALVERLSGAQSQGGLRHERGCGRRGDRPDPAPHAAPLDTDGAPIRAHSRSVVQVGSERRLACRPLSRRHESRRRSPMTRLGCGGTPRGKKSCARLQAEPDPHLRSYTLFINGGEEVRMLRQLSTSLALGIAGAFVSLIALSPVPLTELGGEGAEWASMWPAALISAAVAAALCLSYYQPLRQPRR